MSFAAIFLLAICLNASAKGYSQQVSISEKEVTLEKVFKEINRQTGYTFVYTESLLKKGKKVSITVLNASLEQVLDVCFKDQPITYTILNKMVVIKDKEISLQKEYVYVSPPVNISGRVTNNKGEPLQGVSVLIAGTKKGTTTNIDGRYVLTVPNAENIVLEISNVGFQTKTVNVGKQIEINITLEEAIAGLDQVVVVGYGTQRKVSLTNAVSQVSGVELTKRPVSNVQQALQGLDPGVTVLDQGGVPGRSNATIRVRGVTTLNNNNALIIVDGIEQSLAEINPEDIESISILKDAASTSIYGSRAANGVVLVTTKRGKSGKVTVNLNTAYSLQRTINSPKMMGLRDYMKEQAIAYQKAGSPVPEKFTEESINTWVNATDRYKYPLPNTWFQTLFHVAPRFDNTLSVSGGNEKFKSRVSIRYMNQDGVIPNTEQKLRDVRANLDYSVSNKIKLSANISERYNYSLAPHNLANVLDRLTAGTLWAVPKYPDGTYGLSSQALNPLMFAEIGGTDEQTTDVTVAIVKGEWEIVRGLKFSTQFGVRTENYQGTDYASAFSNTDSLKNIN